MAKLRSILLMLAFIAWHAGVAGAADLGPYKPPVIDVPAPAPVCCESVWYMRGYMGMTNQQVDELTSPTIEAGSFDIISKSYESSPLWGLGFGWDGGHYLRFDVTGEWRGKATFHGLDRYDDDGDGDFDATNDYIKTKSEWLTLFNVYADLGQFHGFTPYAGVGLGAAWIKFDDYADVNVVADSVFFSRSTTNWNFAWALHAGVAYDVTPNFTVDLAYRYVDLGDMTLNATAYDDSGTNSLTFKDITSHDLMLGVRWKLGGGDCCTMPTPFK